MSASQHDDGAEQAARSGRVAAAILIAFAVILAMATSRIEYAFSSDPLGPQAFPYILAATLTLCGLWYFLKPGTASPWPQMAVLRSALVLIAVTAISVGLMDQIGFLLAAFLMSACAAYLFGAAPLIATAIGTVQAVFWFVLFKHALGTYLPSGSWLFPG